MKAACSVLVFAVIVGLAGSGLAHAQQPTDPEGVFRAAIAAFNAGDAELTASYYAEAATITRLCPPADACQGRAEIEAAIQREIDEGVQAEIIDLTVNGNVVDSAIHETAPGLAALGIDRVVINISATVENGLITEMTDELDVSDPQTATFVQAISGEEDATAPAAGMGPGVPRTRPYAWYTAAALTVLAAALFGGGATRRRKFPTWRGQPPLH